MNAILTKYLPIDDGHPIPRIKAFGFQTTCVIDYNNDDDLEANHLCAAVSLLDERDLSSLSRYLVCGQLDDSDYVHTINYEQYFLDKKVKE